MNTSAHPSSLTKHSSPGPAFARGLRHFIVSLLFTLAFSAQAQNPEQETVRTGIHWAKINWYLPLPGSLEPDKSKLPDIYMHPNQLIEYNKDGRMMSIADFKGGTDDVTLSTKRTFWDGPRPKKQVMENSAFEEIYSTTYTCDAAGHEVSQQTKSGPANKLQLSTDGTTESTRADGKLVKVIRKDAKGAVQSETTFTYDGQGRKVREGYAPVFLYSGKSFTWDEKGNVLTETSYDKAGKPSSIFAFEYDSGGRVLKRTLSSYYQDKLQSVEVTVRTYDPQGGCISQKITKDGKPTGNYSWKHTYDKKGGRIQTTHSKDGKAQYVEVLELRYY